MTEPHETSSMPQVAGDAPSRASPIIPRASVAGNALMLVIAIMSFLACLTLGAVMLVNTTATGWQSDIAREITVQVSPVEGVQMSAALLAAQQITGEARGVLSVEVFDTLATRDLLEPWLGSGIDLDTLPVPRLLAVVIDEDDPPDIASLRARLESEVPGASLDDHRAWVERLTTMANATIFSGLVIFSLVMIATIMTVIFATRGALAGNRHVIEVLHFVGAEQSYIARQFQTHFLLLGLKGALAGGVAAMVVFLAVGRWAGQSVADPAADQVSALFGAFSVGPGGYLGVIALIFAIAMLTALTSRFTVLRHVGTLDRSADES